MTETRRIFDNITIKLTGGNGAQRNCRPSVAPCYVSSYSAFIVPALTANSGRSLDQTGHCHFHIPTP